MALQLPWPWPFAAAAPAPVQQHHGEVVAFGEEPTFSLSTGTCTASAVAAL